MMLVKKIKYYKKQYLTIFLSVIILLSGVVFIVDTLRINLDKNLNDIKYFDKDTIRLNNQFHYKINEDNLNVLNKKYGSENVSIFLDTYITSEGSISNNVTNVATFKNGIYVRGAFDNYEGIEQVEIIYGYLWEENTSANVMIIDETTSIRKFGKVNSLGEKIRLKMTNGERIEYEVIAIITDTSKRDRRDNWCGSGDCDNVGTTNFSDLYIPINSHLKYVDEGHNYYDEITEIKITKENISQEDISFISKLVNYTESDLNRKIFSYETLSNELKEEFYFYFKLTILISVFIGVLTYLGNAIVKIVNLYDNKKEIFIHKITGATNKDVFKIYLKEIVVLNLIFLLIPVFILATIFNYIYLSLSETKELFNIISIIKYTFLSFSIVMIIDLLIFSIPILKLSKLKLDECKDVE